MKMRKAEDYRNEIKSYIVRAGMTMSELVEILADEYGWSASVPNLSGKLRRGSLRRLVGGGVPLEHILVVANGSSVFLLPHNGLSFINR